MQSRSRRSAFRPVKCLGSGVIFIRVDGFPVFFRGLGPTDSRAYLDHLLRLSPEDRRNRFHATLTEASLQRHVDGLDWRDRFLFGAYAEGVIRGVAELVEIRESRACEIALSVEKAYQHAAIGRVLMATLLVSASLLGVERMTMLFQSDNVRMRDLALEFGARIRTSSNLAEAEIVTLPSPE